MNSIKSFENFSTNIDVIIHLFKLLNLEDQLRLALATSEFGNIFETYICRNSYRTLAINKNNEDFVVTNETKCDRVTLKPAVFQNFLQFNAFKIKILTERCGPRIDIRPFRNLISLRYCNMRIPRQHLQLIADICPQLESIDFYCCCDEEYEFIVIGKNWSMETLLRMKNLKSLSLQNTTHASINYSDFRQLVKNLKLEYLYLKGSLNPGDVVVVENEIDSVQLKELNIWTTFDSAAYPKNFSSYLINFQNLRKLKVQFLDIINDDILNNMTKACQNLENLYIELSNFENIHTFSIPPKVLELSLYSCHGLNQRNLRQMLTQLKITKFSSVSVDYEGKFIDFCISPNIQSLHVSGVETHAFKSAYEGNVNLKELTWYGEFYATRDSVPLQLVLKLQNLLKLNIPQSMIQPNWTYIEAILKLPKLEEFVINDHSPIYGLGKVLDVPVLGFSSNIKTLQISQEVFDIAMGFWLDLFNQNKTLKMVVYNFVRNTEFMKILINQEKFPRNLKSMDICCFNINCRDLRNNLDATMEKLCNDTVHLSKEYDESLYRIIFRWK